MGLMDFLRWFVLKNTPPAAPPSVTPAAPAPPAPPPPAPHRATTPPLPPTPNPATVAFTNWQGYGYLGIVGESQYQDALFRISRSGTHHVATLLPEPENPFDVNAVCVYIGGMVVGYLPRSYARKYQKRLLTLPEPLRCPAKLIGGTPDKPSFGVLIDQREAERIPAPKRTRKKKETIDPKETPF